MRRHATPGRLQSKRLSKTVVKRLQRRSNARREGEDDGSQKIELCEDDNREPHEILRDLAQGKPLMVRRWVCLRNEIGDIVERRVVEQEVYPDFGWRIECAKAAANYFAPRLSSTRVSGNVEQIAAAMRELAEKLPA